MKRPGLCLVLGHSGVLNMQLADVDLDQWMGRDTVDMYDAGVLRVESTSRPCWRCGTITHSLDTDQAEGEAMLDKAMTMLRELKASRPVRRLEVDDG